MDNTKFLKNVDLFSEFTSDELKVVDKIVQNEECEENTIIFNEGEIGDKMYVIENGVVDIKKQIPMSWGIESVRLARLQSGELFGEISLFDSRPRSAGAVAFFKCKLLTISKSDLENLLDQNPRLAAKMFKQIVRKLGERLRGADEYVRDLTRNAFHC